ncbi:hypothetical protein AAFF_G00396510 [Aldrovandia affinis]|uniref:Uncharacterized protein n=1 Tax=Aldrovandia affinis TaxID=143900 RepID=A0AAD7WKS3_9TELE|nr:hypothetical protein AAFF_G00396510 [Aldrovandia affinis]
MLGFRALFKGREGCCNYRTVKARAVRSVHSCVRQLLHVPVSGNPPAAEGGRQEAGEKRAAGRRLRKCRVSAGPTTAASLHQSRCRCAFLFPFSEAPGQLEQPHSRLQCSAASNESVCALFPLFQRLQRDKVVDAQKRIGTHCFGLVTWSDHAVCGRAAVEVPQPRLHSCLLTVCLRA